MNKKEKYIYKDKNGIELKVGQMIAYTKAGVQAGRIIKIPSGSLGEPYICYGFNKAKKVDLALIKTSGTYFVEVPVPDKIKIQNIFTKKTVIYQKILLW